MRARAAAERTIGSRGLARGSFRIGTTRRLSPTRKGFTALKGLFEGLQSTHRLETQGLYTGQLSIRYKNGAGDFVSVPGEAFVMPSRDDVRAYQKKGESLEETFRRLMTDQLRRAIFRAAQNAPDIADVAEKYEELQEQIESGDTEEARQTLREIKAARNLTFRVSVNRVR